MVMLLVFCIGLVLMLSGLILCRYMRMEAGGLVLLVLGTVLVAAFLITSALSPGAS